MTERHPDEQPCEYCGSDDDLAYTSDGCVLLCPACRPGYERETTTTQEGSMEATHEVQNFLHDALDSYSDDPNIASVQSFADAGVLTNDAGLVVRMADGSEFQLTIVQSA